MQQGSSGDGTSWKVSTLVEEVAELFSSKDFRIAWNAALLASLEAPYSKKQMGHSRAELRRSLRAARKQQRETHENLVAMRATIDELRTENQALKSAITTGYETSGHDGTQFGQYYERSFCGQTVVGYGATLEAAQHFAMDEITKHCVDNHSTPRATHA